MPSSIRLEPAPTARTGVFQFDHAGTLAVLGAATFTTRQGFAIPFNASAFRVHWRNRNFLGEVDSTSTMTGFRAFVGPAEMGADGPTGAFSATPVEVLPATTLVGGTEKVTPWIPTSTLALTKNRRFLLSTAFTCPSGGQVAVGGGGHFASFDGDKAGQLAANAAWTPNQSFFDCFIEYRFVDPLAPCILVVSNSISGPGNVVGGANRGDVDAWHHQWEMTNSGVAASIAVGGSWAANYPANSPKWIHYSTLEAPLSVDAVVLMALMSSDVAGGDGSTGAVDAAKAAFGVVVNRARSLWPSARIIATTLPPRQASSGAQETARLAVNTWLASSPFGVEQCVDLDMTLRNGATPQRLKPEFDSGDGDHWSPRAHAWASSVIPVRSRTR